MPYHLIEEEDLKGLPKLVHVASDHIRIDRVVIPYEGINKGDLIWIRNKITEWENNLSHIDNKEWARAILKMFSDRLEEFCKNSKAT